MAVIITLARDVPSLAPRPFSLSLARSLRRLLTAKRIGRTVRLTLDGRRSLQCVARIRYDGHDLHREATGLPTLQCREIDRASVATT